MLPSFLPLYRVSFFYVRLHPTTLVVFPWPAFALLVECLNICLGIPPLDFGRREGEFPGLVGESSISSSIIIITRALFLTSQYIFLFSLLYFLQPGTGFKSFCIFSSAQYAYHRCNLCSNGMGYQSIYRLQDDWT